MTKKLLMMCALTLLVSGCASNGSYCAIAKPIMYDTMQELENTPDNIVRRIDLHNTTFVKICG